MKNLPVQTLNFLDIKTNFTDFLKGDAFYKDFNFDASGISSLMNLLAYNTHYTGYYTKMLLDEAFVDSAHTRIAMLSHAKRTGYVVKGNRSARADVQLAISMLPADEPLSGTILIPRSSSFKATNSTQDTRVFQVVDDVLVYDRSVIGPNVVYTSPAFTIYEGSTESWVFTVDNTQTNQRFVIKDYDIDVDTIRVNVRDHDGSENITEFLLADDIFEIDETSNVFFFTTNEDGYYQVFFGNSVFGVKPDNNNLVEVTYVSTSGESGNGAKAFTFTAPAADPTNDYNIGNFSSFTTLTVSMASGGMEPEDVDSLRFTVPYHFRRQNRVVTESDYTSVLLEQFRNIDSISVWGGEKNTQRQYGKVFVSIKPKYSDALTSSARNEITNAIVSKYGVVGIEPEFVDPQYIDVDVIVRAKIDTRKTNRSLGEIEALLLDRVSTYNTNTLNRFNTMLSDVNMLDALKDGEDEITSIYDTKTLRKSMTIIQKSTAANDLTFGNAINLGVSSSTFTYAGNTCIFKDDPTLADGNLYIYTNGTKLLPKAFGTVDYTDGEITFAIPAAAVMVGYETSTTAVIQFSVTPQTPDIDTYLNNITRIATTRVILS
jgi:hypothetical protein